MTIKCLALVLSGLVTGALSGQKFAHELRTGAAGNSLDVIVQYQQVPSPEDHRKLAVHGAILKAELSGIHARAYNLTPSALKALENDDRVLYVSPNRSVAGLLDY